MSKRYLSLCSLDHAISCMKTSFHAPDRSERIPLSLAEGRITADPVYAQYDVPWANIAGMDGIAVRSIDTLGAGDQQPVALTDVLVVDTGNLVPPPYDAVIMIEDVWQEGESYFIRKSAIPGQHVRLAGEDIRSGTIIIPRGHQIRCSDISALTTYGFNEIMVKTFRIGIIPVGNELVPIGVRPAPGQVIESNSIFAQSYLSRLGATCTRYAIVPDDQDLLTEAIRKGVNQNDLVIISSGTAAGRRDFTAGSINRLGTLLFHGVAMLPGKPVMVGNIDGKPVIGLPGYPVAAQTVLREIVVRLLVHWGFPFPQEILLPVKIARNMPSELGYDEFIPVSVGNVSGDAWAFPHPRGSGIQMALVRANGYIHIASGREGKEAGTRMDAHLTAAPQLVDRVLLCTGVHEPSIDILGNLLANENIFMHFFNAWNGGAFIALRNSSCSAAAIAMPEIGLRPDEGYLHLLDGVDTVQIHLAETEQGILSRNGITAGDLITSRIINTKRGSSTRMVLDWLLSRDGVLPDQLDGYSREVKSPEAVVNAIRNGSADAGICSSSIATPSGLSFIPLVRETVDLYLRSESLDDPRIQTLITLIKSPEYHSALGKNGGYLTDQTGQARRAIPLVHPSSVRVPDNEFLRTI